MLELEATRLEGKALGSRGRHGVMEESGTLHLGDPSGGMSGQERRGSCSRPRPAAGLQRSMMCSLPPKSSQISCDNHSLSSSFSKCFLNKRADICARELILPATQPELDVQPPKAETRGPPAPDSNEPGRVTRCTLLSPNSSTCMSLA